MGVSGQLQAPVSLPPLYRRLGGPQNRSIRGDEEKKENPYPFFIFMAATDKPLSLET